MRAPMALAVLAVLLLGGGGYLYWNGRQAARLPAGLASANGRIEVERVDIAAKLPGRVAEVRVKEGDPVEKDMIIAALDTTELRAQLAAAKASVERAVASIGRAEAEIAIREAELHLSEVEMHRAAELEQRSAGTRAELERRTAQQRVAAAQVLGARAALADARAGKQLAEAQVDQIQALLLDTVLRTPVSGRVEYKLVQPGEVVAAGGRLVTILDLTDVFMTIFLPTSDVGRVALGSEARVVLDAAPDYVFPARVSFVAAEAQFTPKAVETANEREKLMYRVKLAIDPQLLQTYRDYVKAGMTANGYVQISSGATWPDRLAIRLPDVGK
ncbi:MAG: HlyD family efflux transporter periplasmic adaptor subunit [Hyphomicrobiales bacterium]|nr:HlyD family efflux transporter periplasmic adaptor subunit [Hyphomicrobiales bacterium]